MYRVGADEAIVLWSDLYEVDRVERERQRRDAIGQVFSEGLMVFLSIILVPVLLVPLLWNLPRSLQDSIDIIENGIIIIFVLEYVFKIWVAEDRRAFARNPWHLLDLFIICTSLAGPVINAIFGPSSNKTSVAVFLRLLRLPTAVSLGSRTVKRRNEVDAERKAKEVKELDAEACSLDMGAGPGQREWVITPFPPNVEGAGKWTHISNISVKNLKELGNVAGVPSILLEGKVHDRAYPRAGIIGDIPSVFLRIPEVYHDPNQRRFWFVDWRGVLFLDIEKGLISISRKDIPTVLEVPSDAKKQGIDLDSASVVLILIQRSVSKVEEMILAAEMEQVRIESIPIGKQPRTALSTTHNFKKEITQARTWLRHTRGMLKDLVDNEMRLKGWDKSDEDMARSLLERVDYLMEAADGVMDAFSDAIDFYLNNTSFQMNRVMKVIAVLTALTVIPTVVGGLMGMNLIDNPWPVTLFQMVTLVAVVMTFTGWMYLRLGWLKS